MGGDNSFNEVDFNSSLDSFNGEFLSYNDDLKLDLQELLDEDSVIPISQETSIDELRDKSEYSDPCKLNVTSPMKKNNHLIMNTANKGNHKLSLDSPNLFLKPEANDTNIVANELFQVTNNLRTGKQHHQSDIFGLDDENDDLFCGKRLNNDKIDKLVNELGLRNKGDEIDFELDDQVRTGIFKGRFKKHHHDVDENKDDIDLLLTDYLANGKKAMNDDKENLTPYPDPLKTIRSKDTNSIKKSNKVFFKAPRRYGYNKSSIPVLKPLSNVTNIELKKPVNDFMVRKDSSVSPRRICTPSHTDEIVPFKPSLKYQKSPLNIYLVDSLTGLINDATQFGTELNASNCEGFPLPEHINEIVQIPTNEESQRPASKKQKQKMAIIKAFQNKYYSTDAQISNNSQKRPGFYNKEEYENYKHKLTSQNTLGVQVVNQATLSQTEPADSPNDKTNTSNNKKSPKRQKVRWAEKLEW